MIYIENMHVFEDAPLRVCIKDQWHPPTLKLFSYRLFFGELQGRYAICVWREQRPDPHSPSLNPYHTLSELDNLKSMCHQQDQDRDGPERR